jgi:hypothetical protein
MRNSNPFADLQFESAFLISSGIDPSSISFSHHALQGNMFQAKTVKGKLVDI